MWGKNSAGAGSVLELKAAFSRSNTVQRDDRMRFLEDLTFGRYRIREVGWEKCRGVYS